jgi:hypothetical protein
MDLEILIVVFSGVGTMGGIIWGVGKVKDAQRDMTDRLTRIETLLTMCPHVLPPQPPERKLRHLSVVA